MHLLFHAPPQNLALSANIWGANKLLLTPKKLFEQSIDKAGGLYDLKTLGLTNIRVKLVAFFDES